MPVAQTSCPCLDPFPAVMGRGAREGLLWRVPSLDHPPLAPGSAVWPRAGLRTSQGGDSGHTVDTAAWAPEDPPDGLSLHPGLGLCDRPTDWPSGGHSLGQQAWRMTGSPLQPAWQPHEGAGEPVSHPRTSGVQLSSGDNPGQSCPHGRELRRSTPAVRLAISKAVNRGMDWKEPRVLSRQGIRGPSGLGQEAGRIPEGAARSPKVPPAFPKVPPRPQQSACAGASGSAGTAPAHATGLTL